MELVVGVFDFDLFSEEHCADCWLGDFAEFGFYVAVDYCCFAYGGVADEDYFDLVVVLHFFLFVLIVFFCISINF